MTELFDELREQAQELIDLGDSHEKREGYGMMKVLDALTTITGKFCPEPIYFHLISSGWNGDVQRQEVEINAGDNGKIMIVKTDEGFVIDVYGQNDIVDTLAIWEDTLIGDVIDKDDDGNCKYCGQKCWEGEMCDEQQAGGFNNEEETGAPQNFSDVEVKEWKENWGQSHGEITSELGFPRSHAKADELIIATGNYFWIEADKKWYNKCASMFTEREQAIADYLRS
jgi:hypothetical protein